MNTLVNSLAATELMELLGANPLLARLLLASIEFAVLALIIAGVVKLWRGTWPRLAVYLWTIVLIKPLISLTAGAPLPIVSFAATDTQVQPADEPIRSLNLSQAGAAAVQPLTLTSEMANDSGRPMEASLSESRFEFSGMAAADDAQRVPASKGAPARLNASQPHGLQDWITWLWFVGCFGVTAWLLRSRRMAARLAAGGKPASGPLSTLYDALSEELGVKRPPRLCLLDDLPSPALVGVIRPTILIPTWLTEDAQENGSDVLRWSLRHELTHFKSGDPLLVLLRDVVRSVFFFHPAAWWCGTRLEEAIEVACDHSVVADRRQATEYAKGLYELLNRARTQTGPSHSGGLFATRTQIGQRIASLLQGSLSLGGRLSNLTVATIVLFAAAIFCIGLGMHDAPPATAQDAASNDADPGRGGSEIDGLAAEQADTAGKGTSPAPHQAGNPFELRVVGPDARPVPEATVEIRTKPAPPPEAIRVGTFMYEGNYGSFVKTDEHGRLVAELPENFSLSIKQPEFGPYWAGWDGRVHPETIPSKFTAKLEGGWSVGGVIVDASGEPVSGATVHPYVYFKMRPGDHATLGAGTRIATNADGSWRYESVPDSLTDVRIEINHADFMPKRIDLAKSGFSVEPGGRPTARIVLERGLTISGRVTDEAGEPIAGALIRAKFINNVRETTTGKDGTYQLHGCEPRMTRIVASAKGRAMELQTVRVEPGMDPVNFGLPPGGTIRVRVLDEQGAPIPKTRIFFQRWRGQVDYFEFDHVHSYTDENGVWEWNEAPLDAVEADIAAPGRMQLARQVLKAGEVAEYVFIPPPPLVIHGRVVDAETGEPIKNFRAIPGIRSSPENMNWVQDQAHDVTQGEYRIRQTYPAFHAHLVRIEADNYQVAVSREIASDEGDVRIDFELEKGKNIAATVLTPDGQPAAGAEVVLGVASGPSIWIKNGEVGGSNAERRDADEFGRFSFPSQNEPFQLVITHPAGFAHVKPADGAIPPRTSLTPWARVEGTFRVGTQPVANATIALGVNPLASNDKDAPRIVTGHEVTTGPDGRFVFERAFPGEGRIGRSITRTVDDGATEATSSKKESVTLAAGETLVVELGGEGRPVIGRLAPPEHHEEKVLWSFAQIHVDADLPPAPKLNDDSADAAELTQAWRSALGTLRRTSPRFTATVDRDGTFRIDDVPAGKYKMLVRFSRHAPGQPVNQFEFSVPPMDGGRSDHPFDLGVLTLE